MNKVKSRTTEPGSKRESGSMLLKAIWILAIVGAVSLFSPSSAWALNVYVLRGGDAPSDSAVINALQERGHTPTSGVETPEWDGTQANLNIFDVVVILNNANWGGSLSPAGMQAIHDYIFNGGGVVTGEWLIWQTDPILAPLMPVESCTWDFDPSTTYTVITPDAIIGNGLPSSFTFSLSDVSAFDGTESCFSERPGATVFYSSSSGGGHPNAPGLVGWDIAAGRVISFSTLLGATELTDANYKRLFGNTIEWATQVGTPRVEAVPATPQSPIPCTGSRCLVPVICNLPQALGTPCTNRIDLFVRRAAVRLGDAAPTRAPRRIRFAFGIANVPPGEPANVRLRLTSRGKRIARSGKRRLSGVIEIRNTPGDIIDSTPVRIRIR